MHELAAYTARFHELQSKIVILEPLKTRAQRHDLHRIGKPHLNAGIQTVEVGHIIVQRRLDHIKTEGLFRMLVKAAHDPRHVDAFFAGLKADRAGDRGLQRQIAVVAGVKADRQAEIGNPHMLQMLLGPRIRLAGPFCRSGIEAR